MLTTFFHKVRLILGDPAIRNRLLFLVAALVVFRLIAAVPIPGVDRVALAQFFTNNQFFGLLNIFSGGGFSHLSIVMLGVGPYITASIIMQLATVIFPKVKAMYTEEGEAGPHEIHRALPHHHHTYRHPAGGGLPLPAREPGHRGPALAIPLRGERLPRGRRLHAAHVDRRAHHGIRHRQRRLPHHLRGIVARLPSGLSQALYTATAANIPSYLGFALIALIIIFFVVLVSEAERSIPINYARAGGQRAGQNAPTYLPIRLLQAGVIPIIFALSLLLLPQMILSALTAVGVHGLAAASAGYAAFSANPFEYGAAYFILVIMFTYFYTTITFEPHRVAENLQKSGAFVPGVRPGRETEGYIAKVVNRITLPGAVFLGLVAVIPFIIQGLTGITAILVGGTALLIAVTVVLDLVRKIDAQISLREY